MCDQRIDRGLQPALHDFRQLVIGESDAVIGEAILRKVVGADLFAPVAASHLAAPFLRQRLLLAFHLDFINRARRTRMPFSRFLICDFSSWQLTTVLVGRCVMRTAEYVVLTD